MDPELQKLLEDLKKDIRNLSRKSIVEYAGEFVVDDRYLDEFLSMHLKRWTEELKSGKLSKEDFEYHLKSKLDLMDLVRMKRRGLNRIRVDKLRADLLQLILSATLKSIGI